MAVIDPILVIASLLVLLGVIVSKISGRFGLPALLLFLLVGMLAGSEGPGGIYFDNYVVAQSLGVVALSLILFDGGLRTNYQAVRAVFWSGLSLSTVGVAITAVSFGVVAKYVLNVDWAFAILLGAVVSSTDAAAVFSILRSKGFSLNSRSQSLLELESGSNDPMAVLLTVGIIASISNPEASLADFVLLFARQLIFGVLFGYIGSILIVKTINKIRLPYDGLYPVLLLSSVIFVYSGTSALGGSGFLAVYLTGLLMSKQDFIHKRSLTRFHDGIAWIMQIGMFLVLGLLVFPSHLVPVALSGTLLAFVLMTVSRPLAVFLALPTGATSFRDKLMISWVGLRGATPIILATFPLLAGIKNAELIFNMVFYVVLISVVLQGISIPVVAKWLGVAEPMAEQTRPMLEFSDDNDSKDKRLEEFIIGAGSSACGKSVVNLSLPGGALIVMLTRGKSRFVPRGETVLEAGDRLLMIFDRDTSDLSIRDAFK